MDAILERILAEADRNYGLERARELRAILDQVALDLEQLTQYPLNTDDAL